MVVDEQGQRALGYEEPYQQGDGAAAGKREREEKNL